jgi:hypothetical protein
MATATVDNTIEQWERPMNTRIVIQHRVTGMYLKALGNWTQFEPDAFSFSNTSSALLFCLRHHLSPAVIVMKFGEQRYDIQLPVCDEGAWNQSSTFAQLLQ